MQDVPVLQPMSTGAADRGEPAAGQPINPHWLRRLTLTAVLVVVAYAAVVFWAGHAQVAAALKTVDPLLWATLCGLSLINYGLRFLRWHYYLLRLGSRIPWRASLRIYIGGFAFTTTPGKAGELARAIWLKPYGIPVNHSVAVFLAERIQDFIAVMLLACVGLSFYPGGWILLLAGAAMTAVALAVLFIPALPAALARWATRVAGPRAGFLVRLTDILSHTRRCLSITPLAVGLALGLAAWFAQCWGFYLLTEAMSQPLPARAAVSIYAFSMLAGAVSMLPGGLGGADATLIALLRLWGLGLGVAVAATLLINVATLWLAVALGVLALWLQARSRA